VGGEDLMMCQMIGRPPISTIGLAAGAIPR